MKFAKHLDDVKSEHDEWIFWYVSYPKFWVLKKKVARKVRLRVPKHHKENVCSE